MDLGLHATLRELPAVPGAHPGEYERIVPEFGLARDGRDAAGRGAAARAARAHPPHLPASSRPAPTSEPEVAPEAFESYGRRSRPKLDDLSGWLIVIEGPDGVGRTTHVNRLRAHLERLGYAVAETGLTRSDLASKGIRGAKEGNTLGSNAFNLFYATDFADRLEQPDRARAARGFVMITDRYIYSLIARAIVRGADPDWIKQVYSFALKPDAVFYLRIERSCWCRACSRRAVRLLGIGHGRADGRGPVRLVRELSGPHHRELDAPRARVRFHRSGREPRRGRHRGRAVRERDAAS
jgi:thymidylate kinase